MKFFAVAATLVSVIPAITALRIETPTNAVQCQPLLLTWSDGQAPFFVSVIPGGQPAAPATKSFPPQNGNSLTWLVDIARGTPLTMSIKDGTGAQQYSDIFTILDSTDNKCVNSTVQITGSGGTPATGGNTPATAGNTPVPTGAGSTGAAGSTNTTKPTGTGTGAAPTKSNAASKSIVGAFGLAGVMGFVGAILL